MRTQILSTLVSFVIMVVTYGTYDLLIVDLIEGAPELDVVIIEPGETRVISTGFEDKLIGWVGESSWEVEAYQQKSLKRLENEQGMLLFQQYQNRPDGTVRLWPCTMIFHSGNKSRSKTKTQKSPQGEFQRYTVLKSPEGALLKFSRPLDLQQGKMGDLVGGKLVGDVTIFGNNRLPGPEDDIYVETKDIEFTTQVIWTPNEVKFKYGPNSGYGQKLQIQLTSVSNDSGGKTSGFEKIRWVQIKQNVVMNIIANKNIVADSTDQHKQPGKKVYPVVIRSKGPFRFDFEDHLATFREQVTVVQEQESAPADQMLAELLEIYFKPLKRKVPKKGSFPKLIFHRLAASGFPVTIQSPSRSLTARGNILQWNDLERKLSLSNGAEQNKQIDPLQTVEILQDGQYMRAPTLHCALDNTGTPLNAQAVGPGTMRIHQSSKPGFAQTRPINSLSTQRQSQKEKKPVDISWSTRLDYGPDKDQFIASVIGNAHVESLETGSLSSENLYLWLKKNSQAVKPDKKPLATLPPQAGLVQPSGSRSSNKSNKKAFDLSPDRLFAENKVHIESDSMIGDFQELRLAFVHRNSPIGAEPNQPQRELVPLSVGSQENGIYRTQKPSTGNFVTGNQVSGVAVQAEQKQYHMRAQTLQATIVMKDSKSHLSDAWAEGEVKIVEISQTSSDKAPLELRGRTLQIVNEPADQSTARITGSPATVSGQGMSLQGGVINMHRTANRVWIDGPGSLILPRKVPNQATVGNVANPTNLKEPPVIRWKGGMTFNGQLAQFDQTVEAQLGARLLQTNTLEIHLTDRIDFSQNAKRSRKQIDVHKAICPDEFTLYSQSGENGKLASLEFIQAAYLTYDHLSGDISADGPGYVKQTRWSESSISTEALTPKSVAANNLKEKPQETKPQLHFLKVYFQTGLKGNMQKQNLSFLDVHDTVYGPVTNWDQELTPDNLGKNGMWLRCQELIVRRMQSVSGKGLYNELESIGNVQLEASQFSARGQRLTYADEKSLIILEGDGRNDAFLWRQPYPGAARSQLSARKIHYWRLQDRVKLEDVRNVDLSQIKGDSSEDK